jgi:archaeosine-15-forming tRNA-guanine transglycosylase
MGIRMTQVYGLNEAAMKLLTGNGEYLIDYEEEVTVRYADGRVEHLTRNGSQTIVESEPSGSHYHGMFEGEVYDLERHVLPDGRVFVEREYASPWASGPCIFLALVEEGGKEWRPADEAAYADYGLRPAAWVRESLWTDQEISDSI